MKFTNLKQYLAVTILTFFLAPAFSAQLIDINSADASAIAENLNGIGSKKAQAIVAYRKLHGNFQNADDLTKVKGIGNKLIERNIAYISYGKSATGISKSSNIAAGESATGVQSATTTQPVLNGAGSLSN